MTVTEYQIECRRTCPSLGDLKLDLAHMVLGLHSEYSELVDAEIDRNKVNVSEELADHMWYLANYCTFRDYQLENMMLPAFDPYTLEYATSKLQDLVKKHIAYNKPIDDGLEFEALSSIYVSLLEIYEQAGIDMAQSLQNNIDKLKVRFPDGFSEEKANNRDLNSELDELKK